MFVANVVNIFQDIDNLTPPLPSQVGVPTPKTPLETHTDGPHTAKTQPKHGNPPHLPLIILDSRLVIIDVCSIMKHDPNTSLSPC